MAYSSRKNLRKKSKHPALWTSSHVDDLKSISSEILKIVGQPTIITFRGDLGSGKTTLIQHLCAELEVVDSVTSPTFALVNNYQCPRGMVHHLDLYRIESLEEALSLGIEEYLEHPFFTFIEWPEVIDPLLPEDCWHVSISDHASDGRKIVLLYGPAGQNDRS